MPPSLKTPFIKNILKFGIVGVFSTIIHSTIYLIGIKQTALDAQVANLIGYLSAVIFSYFSHKFWTFSQPARSHSFSSITKFFVASTFSLGLNSFWVYLLSSTHIPTHFAVVGFLFFTPIITFVLLRFWVFRS